MSTSLRALKNAPCQDRHPPKQEHLTLGGWAFIWQVPIETSAQLLLLSDCHFASRFQSNRVPTSYLRGDRPNLPKPMGFARQPQKNGTLIRFNQIRTASFCRYQATTFKGEKNFVLPIAHSARRFLPRAHACDFRVLHPFFVIVRCRGLARLVRNRSAHFA
jgi:hypothetical protein